MGQKERKAYIAGWEKEAEGYYKKWREAKDKEDDANRAHYSIQYADAKEFLKKLKGRMIDILSHRWNDDPGVRCMTHCQLIL